MVRRVQHAADLRAKRQSAQRSAAEAKKRRAAGEHKGAACIRTALDGYFGEDSVEIPKILEETPPSRKALARRGEIFSASNTFIIRNSLNLRLVSR